MRGRQIPEKKLGETVSETIGGVIVVAGILLLIFVWSPRQLKLAFVYSVAPWKVEIAPYPDDECSFWHVPRGLKDCEHEEIIRTLDRDSRPIAPNSPSLDRIIVTWGTKIDKHKK